jgi:hypothetical protein
MVLAFVATAAVSAFCKNVGASSPLSIVRLSFANPPVQMLAQARADSDDQAINPETSTNSLVSDGLQKPGGEDSQAGANSKSSNDKTEKADKDDPPATGRCKNGQHVGNKHCVPSPSE